MSSFGGMFASLSVCPLKSHGFGMFDGKTYLLVLMCCAGLDKWRREKLKHAQSREAALLKTEMTSQEKGSLEKLSCCDLFRIIIHVH